MCVSTLTVLFGVERPVLWVMVGAREAEGSQTLLLGAEGLLNMVVFFLTVSSIYLYLYIFDPLFSVYALIISVFTVSIHMYIYEHKARAVESKIGYVNTDGSLVTAGNLIPGEVLLESKLIH